MHEIVIDRKVNQVHGEVLVKLESNKLIRYGNERRLPIVRGFSIYPQHNSLTTSPVLVPLLEQNNYLLPPYYVLFLEYPIHIKNMPGKLNEAKMIHSDFLYVLSEGEIFPITNRLLIGAIFELNSYSKEEGDKIVYPGRIEQNRSTKRIKQRRPPSTNINVPNQLRSMVRPDESEDKESLNDNFRNRNILGEFDWPMDEFPANMLSYIPTRVPAIFLVLIHKDLVRTMKAMNKYNEFYDTIRNLEYKFGDMGFAGLALHILNISDLNIRWDIDEGDVKIRLHTFNPIFIIDSNKHTPLQHGINIYILIHAQKDSNMKLYQTLLELLSSLASKLEKVGIDKDRGIVSPREFIDWLEYYSLRISLPETEEEHHYEMDTADVSTDFDGGDADVGY